MKVFKNTPNLAICIFWKCFSRNCVCYLKEKGDIKSFEIISKRKKFYRKKSLIVRSLIERIIFGTNLCYNSLNFFLILINFQIIFFHDKYIYFWKNIAHNDLINNM